MQKSFSGQGRMELEGGTRENHDLQTCGIIFKVTGFIFCSCFDDNCFVLAFTKNPCQVIMPARVG